MQYRDLRQETTGIVVNKKLNVPTEYYHLARAMRHQLVKTGAAYAKVDGEVVPISEGRLRGMLSHIFYVRRLKNRAERPAKKDQPAYYRLYAEFLDFIPFTHHTADADA